MIITDNIYFPNDLSLRSCDLLLNITIYLFFLSRCNIHNMNDASIILSLLTRSCYYCGIFWIDIIYVLTQIKFKIEKSSFFSFQSYTKFSFLKSFSKVYSRVDSYVAKELPRNCDNEAVSRCSVWYFVSTFLWRKIGNDDLIMAIL